jgi:hypothetical protein
MSPDIATSATLDSLATIALPTPQLPLPALTERALLAALTIREWRGRRRDQDVTDRVARDHGADRKLGCFTKALLPKSYLARIAHVRTEARTTHHRLTLPWCDDGLRILPVDLHLDYMDRLRLLRSRFDDAVADFLAAYDEAKTAARTALGSLYRDADYPSSRRLRAAFSLDVKLQPLPTGRDWRIDLPADAVERIRLDLETRLHDAQRLALADLYRRLAAVVSRMATTLAKPDAVFRDSLVRNVRDLCALLPSLNLAGDQGLADLTRDVDVRLARLDPGRLRTDPATRNSAALDAAALLHSLEGRLASYTGAAA